jgi:hypothetical protein
MNIETYVRALVAQFAIQEGQRYGGINNMLGVCHVIRNRVMAGWGDWREVIQHAAEKRGTIYPDELPDIRVASVRALLGRIDEIYARTDLIDLTGGALFYYDPTFPIEKWFKEGILDRPDDHKRVAHIGPVWFYK